MLRNYCKLSRCLKNLYWRSLRQTIHLLSPLALLCINTLWATEPYTDDFVKVGFVAFDIGEYRQGRFGQVGQAFKQLQSYPDNIPIRLIGHSHSKVNQASDKYAAMRADTVRDQLINFGISDALITIDYDVQNFLSSNRLMHGVSVLVSPEVQSSGEVISQHGMITSKKRNTLSSPSSVQAVAVVPSSDIEVEPNTDLCNLISIHSGSLRDNLEREISDCGYIIGRWRFGTGDEVIDWHVPVSYNTVADNGIIGLLQLVESNYQIRAQIHELDDSIDFFPSIRDRGSRNQ